MYFVCVCYAEWNFNYSHYLLSVVCGVFLCWQFLLSLTTLSLRAVDSSKVVGGLPWEEMSEVFAQTWDKLFSRSRVQDKHSKVSSMPAALYLGPHIITGQQQLLTTTEKSQWQFSGLYISFFFKETSLFDWRLVRASVRYFSRTLVAGRKLVGWGGVLRCWMGRGRIDSIAFPIIKTLPISSTTSPSSPS